MKVRLTIASLIATLCLAGCSSANTSSLASQPDESSTSVTASASDESRSSAGQTGQDTSAADSSEAVSSSDSESSDVKRIDYELDTSKPTIAITFDDGPNATTTMEVLDILEKYQVRASFFLIGTNINDESAKSVKRAFDLGCDIENHSKTHSYMDKMTADEIKDEVAYVNDKVKEITGTTPKFFRPPYIAVNDTMYENIDMTFISGNGCNDWDDKVTAEYRAKYLEKKAADGVIFLLHDAEGNSKTVEALDKAIPILLEKGFQFATISELFELKGIEISGTDTNIYSELIAG
ncbi:polysaccharide deacetylase [[Eubacterium] siraeum DSM 15702]|uniref:Polysaccharide deacetylase n=1 Tax=[Eubacterium] siraeum DSM 15702 TaxID=428128 RepID=B0MK38_9FIRM|nr:polysaccharide deacetylase [[Eubacterium] siraeum DSM 15702]UWP24419.1 polysaccharide deacetylase family protein [[Eubacterium] siraeum]